MMKKWIVKLCSMACMASLLVPIGVAVESGKTGQHIVYAAEDTQYADTLTIPVTDSIKPVQVISVQGTITDVNTENVYLLNVEESAVTLSIEGNTDHMQGQLELQTLMGTTLEKCSLGNSSPVIDTTTTLRQESIQNYYLAKGQYLCKISKYSGGGELSYTVKAHSVDAAETKTISFEKKYLSYGDNVQYKKVTVKKSGRLTIQCNQYKNLSDVYDTQLVNNDGAKFTLCNQNKKAITAETNWMTTSKSYGVKKGTYYIKFSNIYENWRDYRTYSVSFTYADLASNKKSTAKTITKKWQSYTMLSGGTEKNSAQWFKFTLKKAKKLKLYVANLTDDKIQVEIYNKKNRDENKILKQGQSSSGIRRLSGGKEVKWPKGTYYVKITKYFSDASGIIKLKLK